MKTLCIYALHEYNLNVEFFIQNGIIEDPDIDFYFVVNNPTLKLEVPKCTVINRENINMDFGGWSHVLFTRKTHHFLYEKYDYFIFINSSVRGPFYPSWYKDKNWVKLFTDKITPEVKLFGTMICFFDYKPHVQSMMMVTDKVGLQIGINHSIFSANEPKYDKGYICSHKEIGYSTAILQSGYNIGCMLKAYDGVDFRKASNKIHMLGFFGPYSYFGINPHPYELIFSKVSMGYDIFDGYHKTIIDKFTNWTSNPQELKYEDFDWVYYLLKYPDLRNAGISTKTGASKHYEIHGKEENRLINQFKSTPNYYLIDLNPLTTSGLLNQFWSLINGILIGHYVGRNVVVENFYPDYNKIDKIPIEAIIDIDSLNCLIVELGLNTYVTTKVQGANWLPSRYYNPTKETFDQYGFINTLALLKSEAEKYLDIHDTFTDTMFKNNIDPEIKQLFIRLLTGLKFSWKVRQIIKYIKKILGLTSSYKVIHLRLEDDMIKYRPFQNINEYEYGMMVYNQYKEKINQHMNPSDIILLSTHLTKSPNLMNFTINDLSKKYSRVVINDQWRNVFPDFYKGREIDALIDYLLSLDGIGFIGHHYSTFSQAIKYYYDIHSKENNLL